MEGEIKNIIVVESPNDAAFLKVLLAENGIDDTSIEIIDLHKFPSPTDPSKELRGKEAVGAKLQVIKRDLELKYPFVEKIGVVLDMDYWSLGKNLDLVNKAAQFAFSENPALTAENEWKEILLNQVDKIQLACHFVKGYTDEEGGIGMDKGNLDTLLYTIRANPETKVPYADCLDEWRRCVNASPDSLIQVSDGTFCKIWLDYYLRVKAKEIGGKVGKRISNDYEAKKHEVITETGAAAFDLRHSALHGLLGFVNLFKT